MELWAAHNQRSTWKALGDSRSLSLQDYVQQHAQSSKQMQHCTLQHLLGIFKCHHIMSQPTHGRYITSLKTAALVSKAAAEEWRCGLSLCLSLSAKVNQPGKILSTYK